VRRGGGGGGGEAKRQLETTGDVGHTLLPMASVSPSLYLSTLKMEASGYSETFIIY
jgi:hypothetical protein